MPYVRTGVLHSGARCTPTMDQGGSPALDAGLAPLVHVAVQFAGSSLCITRARTRPVVQSEQESTRSMAVCSVCSCVDKIAN